VLVISPGAFNRLTKVPIVLPITCRFITRRENLIGDDGTLTRLAALGTLSRTAGAGGTQPAGWVGEGVSDSKPGVVSVRLRQNNT